MKAIFYSLLVCLTCYSSFSQCVANFSITNNSNGSVTFANTSIANPNSKYTWYFGNGTHHVVVGNAQQTRSFYNGVYTATLQVNDTISSCTSSASLTFTVNTAPCNGSITNIIFGQQANGYCTFSQSTTGIDHHSSFSWNFSDGYTSAGVTTSHTFTNSGVYTVTLTTSDLLGICNYTFQKTFTVTTAPCALTPSFTYSLGANGLVTFQSTSTGTSPSTTYYWSFGDGYAGYYGPGVSHTYLNSGMYNVNLQIHDSINFGCTSYISQLINYTGCVNSLSFSIYKDSTQLPAIVWNVYPSYAQNTSSVTWDWGDGTTTSGIMYPSHTYSASGTFSICVSTTVSCGTTNTYCMNSSIFKMSESLQGPSTINVTQIVTGIKQTELITEVKAFPNPITDELTIEVKTTDNSKLTYMLTDAVGRTISTGNLNNSRAILNTGSLEHGFYSLSITSEKGSALKTIKLVK